MNVLVGPFPNTQCSALGSVQIGLCSVYILRDKLVKGKLKTKHSFQNWFRCYVGLQYVWIAKFNHWFRHGLPIVLCTDIPFSKEKVRNFIHWKKTHWSEICSLFEGPVVCSARKQFFSAYTHDLPVRSRHAWRWKNKDCSAWNRWIGEQKLCFYFFDLHNFLKTSFHACRAVDRKSNNQVEDANEKNPLKEVGVGFGIVPSYFWWRLGPQSLHYSAIGDANSWLQPEKILTFPHVNFVVAASGGWKSTVPLLDPNGPVLVHGRWREKNQCPTNAPAPANDMEIEGKTFLAYKIAQKPICSRRRPWKRFADGNPKRFFVPTFRCW